MPEEPIVEAEEGTTVIFETGPDEPSPFALIGASGVGEPGAGGGGGGGGPSFGGGPTGVVVDGSTGEVVGSATIDPQAGVAEVPGVDVTVVEETSSPPGTPSGAGGGPAPESHEAVAAAPAVPVGPAEAPGEQDIIFQVVPPSAFHFTQVKDGWMESDCVKIVFAKPTVFGPGTIEVGVIVGAPTWLPEHRAQTDAADSATEVGRLMIAELRAGLITPGQLTVRFAQTMALHIRGVHPQVGYTVSRCTPQ